MERGLCPYASTSHAYLLTDRSPRMIAQPCNKWSCDICGPRRKAKLVRKIIAAHPVRFMTLTCLHIDTPAERLALMRKALPRLITELRKQYGPIEYLRMLETCRDGYPHFHLLIRSAYLEHSRIKELWTRYTGATIVDIRKAHGRSTGYVAKYLGKACDEEQTWSRQRISVSHNFWVPQLRDDELIGWEHELQHPQEEARAHPATNYDREWLGRYIPRPRQPGDELPIELQSAEPTWIN